MTLKQFAQRVKSRWLILTKMGQKFNHGNEAIYLMLLGKAVREIFFMNPPL